MSRSPSRDLCWLGKMLWEEHPKNKGREYDITGRDMKEAKELLSAGNIIEADKLKDRISRFMDSDFEGWIEADYPLWALFKHWNRYAPPRKAAPSEKVMIQCSFCGKPHGIHDKCEVHS